MPDLKIIYRAIDDLVEYENNTRTHSDEQIEQITASIREFGFTNPVLIDGNNRLIAGHGRVKAAPGAGLSEVPCIVIDHLSDTQIRALTIADNQLALNAGWDEDLMSQELNALAEDDFDLGLLGFSVDELNLALSIKEDMTAADIRELEEMVGDSPKTSAEFEKVMSDKTTPGIVKIVPRYAEHHQAFIILCNNTIDENWIRQKLNLDEPRGSYKDKTFRQANIIAASDLRSIIK